MIQIKSFSSIKYHFLERFYDVKHHRVVYNFIFNSTIRFRSRFPGSNNWITQWNSNDSNYWWGEKKSIFPRAMYFHGVLTNNENVIYFINTHNITKLRWQRNQSSILLLKLTDDKYWFKPREGKSFHTRMEKFHLIKICGFYLALTLKRRRWRK